MKRIEREYGLGGFALSVYFSIGKSDCLKEISNNFSRHYFGKLPFSFFSKIKFY